MNASKHLWSIFADSNEMPVEVDQVPLKELAQAQRQHWGSAKAGGRVASLTHRVTLLLPQHGPHHDSTVWMAFNNSNQRSLIWSWS